MRVQVKKWGNSASVRIPAAVMAAARLEVDQTIELRVVAGKVVLDPVVAPEYDLEALLDGLSPDTFPDDADFGPPRGREVW